MAEDDKYTLEGPNQATHGEQLDKPGKPLPGTASQRAKTKASECSNEDADS